MCCKHNSQTSYYAHYSNHKHPVMFEKWNHPVSTTSTQSSIVMQSIKAADEIYLTAKWISRYVL